MIYRIDDPRRRRRIYLWAFTALQVVFLAWVIIAIVSGSGVSASHCTGLSEKACKNTDTLGTAVGVGLIVAVWASIDLIIGIAWAIVKLKTRRP
jgi:uncharacterized membrane protein